MADSAQFQIEILAAADQVVAAGTRVDALTESLAAASTVSKSAVEAVAAAGQRYSELEAAADKAAKSVEKSSLAIDQAAAALAKTSESGNIAAHQKAAEKLAQLSEQHTHLVAAAQTSQAALSSEAAKLDGLKSAAAAAGAAEQSLASDLETAAKRAANADKQLDQAMKHQADAAKAASDAVKAGKAAETKARAEAAKAAVEDAHHRRAELKDSKESLAALAGVGAAVLTAFVAAGVGIYSILSATVAFADKTHRVDAAQQQLQKNLAKTFGGLKIGGLLDGLDTLVALFDSSTASGRALKFLFETLFQPIVDAVVACIPMVERLFLQAEILALKAYIALKPYSSEIATVAKWFGIAAAVIGGIVVASIALFIAFVGIGIAIIAAIVTAIVALVGWLVGALPKAWAYVSSVASAAWDAIVGAVSAAWDWLSSLSLSDIGSALIDGLVSGITSAASAVLGAITGVVGGAIDAAKSLLGIASPSKIFAEIGMQTGAGMAGGVDASAGDVQSSMADMTAPPDAASPAGGTAGAAGKGSNVYTITINAPSGKADDIATALRGVLTDILEGDVSQLQPVAA